MKDIRILLVDDRELIRRGVLGRHPKKDSQRVIPVAKGTFVTLCALVSRLDKNNSPTMLPPMCQNDPFGSQNYPFDTSEAGIWEGTIS